MCFIMLVLSVCLWVFIEDLFGCVSLSLGSKYEDGIRYVRDVLRKCLEG